MNPAIDMSRPGRAIPFVSPYSGPAPRALHPDAMVRWVNKPYASAYKPGGPPLRARRQPLTLPYGSPHTHQHNAMHARVGRDNCLGGLGQLVPPVQGNVLVNPAFGSIGVAAGGGWSDADADQLAVLIEQRRAARAQNVNARTTTIDAQIRELRRRRARHMTKESKSWFLDLPPVVQGVALLVGGVFAIRLLGVFKG